MTKNDYIEKITQNLEHLTKDELKDVATLTNAQFEVRLKVAEKEYWGKEIADLKSQLQQQALPVVPEFVAEWLDSNNLASLLDEWYCHHEDMSYHIREYFERLPYKGPNNLSEMENNIVTFITRAKLGGYKLEKPQLFHLKNKLTNSYLCQYPSDKSFYHIVVDDDGISKLVTKFTKQEIDSMQTGSYELVPVEDEE